MNSMGNFIGYARNEYNYRGGILTLDNTQDIIPRNSFSVYLDTRNPLSYSGSGTTWTNLAGAQNGTLSAGVSYNTALSEGVFLMGAGDNITLGTGFNYTTESFSFSWWISFLSHISSGATSNIHLCWKGNFQLNGYYFQLNTASKTLSFFTNKSGTSVITSSSAIRIHNWYNIIVTRNATSVKIYANGDNITSSSGSHSNPDTAGTNTFQIGSYDSSATSNFRLAQFLHYTKELTAAEVKQIYNASKWRFGY